MKQLSLGETGFLPKAERQTCKAVFLGEKGLSMKRGMVVNATLIAAPNSTKNQDEQRDPEMTQTKKGNQWLFGMKAHIGVDAESGLIHTVECNTAKVAASQ